VIGLARAALACCVVAVIVTVSDLWFARRFFVSAPGGLDGLARLELASGIAGVHACLAFLIAPLVGLGTWCLRRRVGRWSTACALGGLLLLLNRDLIHRQPWVALLLLVFALGLPLGHDWASSVTRRRWAVGIAALVGTAAAAVNADVSRGTNLPQHQSLLVCMWIAWIAAVWVGVWPWLTHQADSRRRMFVGSCLTMWATAGLFAWQLSSGTSQMSSRAQFVLRVATPAAGPTLSAFDRMTDVDRDGYAAWFGGGDCAPFDASVSPAGLEWPGDGIDGNCMAGDPSPSLVDELRHALAGTGQSVRSARVGRVDRLLLITVDALRHDAKLPLTWSKLGRRCRRFERAYATSHGTTDAVYSLMRSRFSSQGQFSRIGEFTMPMNDHSPTLPELLGAEGYATSAVVFHHRFDPRMKLTRGFDHVWIAEARREIIQGIAAPSTIAQAVRWHETAHAPWFSWVHFYDVHAPYLDHGRPVSSAREAYDAEVDYTDAKIVEFLEALGDDLDRAAVILTSDHGEAFGEHGTFLHANTLFEEELRVPLWVCPPDARSETLDVAVSGIDVAPTILSWANVGRPASFLGRSLLGPLEAVPVHAASALDGVPMHALILGRHKLIRHLPGDAYALFDLFEDPNERVDLTRSADDDLTRMQAALDRFVAVLATHPS
jgi:arylsulfatase A-like enzyme